MRQWLFVIAALSTLSPTVLAQLKEIPPPPEFQKLIGPAKFDPAKLREMIEIPIAGTRRGFEFKSGLDEDIPPVAVIRKKLVGDERDAEWLFKLGYMLDLQNKIEQILKQKESGGATDAFEKSAAAFRKRIEREPKNAKHYADIREPLYALDQTADALKSAKKCLDLDPDNSAGWRKLASFYWREFSGLVYPDGREMAALIRGNGLPSEIEKPLTEGQKDKARTLLAQIRHCYEQWQRCAPADARTQYRIIIHASGLESCENYLRNGVWNDKENSKRLQQKLLEHARKIRDIDMIGGMATGGGFLFEFTNMDQKWTLEELSAARKTALAPYFGPLEKFAASKDAELAIKANLHLAVAHFMMEDDGAAQRYAAKALALAPCERAVIDVMVKMQREDAEFEKFWEKHVRQHPSTRVWLQLAASHLRNKKYDDADRCLREGEKLDAKDRTIQLAKAALALKRGEASLGDATRILDALEKRLDEPDEKDALFDKCDLPGFPDACRYLRAMHTALSGKWEQGREQLFQLAEEGVMPEAIHAALASFPK